ncbi:MAG: TetR/AcrR family transcriptional regulator [Burkholderiaceae bacterium]|jgi:AcrR family transcriptional regulator|nr:TetR/AcrR family transcriptional regulator [Burkholderiaceae bacterium]
MATKSKESLSASDWIDAAWDAIGTHGMAGVRVEALATKMKVTKGSFYWHFKDRDALIDAVVQRWLEVFSIKTMESALKGGAAADERLWQLFERVVKELSTAHSAVLRLWARNSPKLMTVLHAEHEKRMGFVSRAFRELGFDERESLLRADMYLSLLMGEYLVAGGLPLERRLARAKGQVELLTTQMQLASTRPQRKTTAK